LLKYDNPSGIKKKWQQGFLTNTGSFFFLLPESSADSQTSMHFKLRSMAKLKAVWITFWLYNLQDLTPKE